MPILMNCTCGRQLRVPDDYAGRRIKCPACFGNRDLIRMVDPLQPHIWFESCKGCYGRFYDAGEYRDFAEIEFADLIRDWNAPERL